MTACRNHGIKTKFYIVLSGFSDFAYVKSAAQIGIENYLLKPIDHPRKCPAHFARYKED
ncbi:MAG: hypothetical protein ACLSGB_06135 [Dorea sp.]